MNARRKTEIRMSQQLFIVISTPTTDEALVREAVEKLKTMGEVTIEQRPALFSEWYHCPALNLPNGHVIFGIDGIRLFVEQELAGASRWRGVSQAF